MSYLCLTSTLRKTNNIAFECELLAIIRSGAIDFTCETDETDQEKSQSNSYLKLKAQKCKSEFPKFHISLPHPKPPLKLMGQWPPFGALKLIKYAAIWPTKPISGFGGLKSINIQKPHMRR
jgi:hypothetical protein